MIGDEGVLKELDSYFITKPSVKLVAISPGLPSKDQTNDPVSDLYERREQLDFRGEG